MQLVQDMEVADERDSEGYVDRLEQILALKFDAITSLRMELNEFQSSRKGVLEGHEPHKLIIRDENNANHASDSISAGKANGRRNYGNSNNSATNGNSSSNSGPSGRSGNASNLPSRFGMKPK